MTDENLFEGISDFDVFKNQIQEILIGLSQRIDQRFTEVDDLIEKIEKQIATLILGFGEQAVNTEALIAQLRFSSEEAQKSFMDTVAESRKQMLRTMKEGADGLLAREDPGLASAIESLADEKLSD